ncbi:two-component system, chemotaxis family, response regulator CheY [Gracilibacillus orientalis]|uniref:Two-component system, chemotaxis family, response regulator CheY n=1 Tax=Gracilibacillus orientalis TaxID=334253 RepID=A0A1I4HM65_9BACI|nr:response regulator [Gracilibacillus orientalis]SFL43234.1 two-component system, chemotaxis family, response regulator CheY [Gracilibacillus orientalis]
MKKTVIIADDSRFMRHWLKQTIEKHHYLVIAEASTGLESIKAYQQHKPDIIILDIIMPKSNGLDALKKIKGLDPCANVIMVSSLATHDNVTRALHHGAKDFIIKPHFHNLIQIMDNIFD